MIKGKKFLKKHGTPVLTIIICHSFDVSSFSSIFVDIILCKKFNILGASNDSDSSRPDDDDNDGDDDNDDDDGDDDNDDDDDDDDDNDGDDYLILLQ